MFAYFFFIRKGMYYTFEETAIYNVLYTFHLPGMYFYASHQKVLFIYKSYTYTKNEVCYLGTIITTPTELYFLHDNPT